MGPLIVVVLFLVASGAAQEFGEYCHGWTDTYGSWHRGFQCPERYDPQEATYCCGSCNLRYCCTASESRLDQGQCPGEEQNQAPGDGVPIVPLTPSVPIYLPFLLVGSMFVTFVLIGSLVGVCCCRCLKPEEGVPIGVPAQQSGLLDTEVSTDTSRHSSSSAASAPRGTVTNNSQNLCTLGADNRNLYMNMPTAYPIMACPPNAQFMHHATSAAHFLQPPFINYAVPADHAVLMTQTPYIDNRNLYPQATNAYLPLSQHIDIPIADEATA